MSSPNEENNASASSKNSKTVHRAGVNEETYDLYPERKGGKRTRGWWYTLLGFEARSSFARIRCEQNVYNCVKDSDLVKLMMGALKNAGCEVDIRRHIVCEECDMTVTGGYDPTLNQIVVCQNTAKSQSMVQGVLSHEMIHMFDYCQNKLDFENIDHLACTEIRAANLCHCSFMSAMTQGLASPMNIKEAHQDCVKDKAMRSVMAVRKVTAQEAQDAVLRVFDKCYNDLEPVGRRLRRNSLDMRKAYLEGHLYGYVDD